MTVDNTIGDAGTMTGNTASGGMGGSGMGSGSGLAGSDTTSTGMPPIASAHNALDAVPMQGAQGGQSQSRPGQGGSHSGSGQSAPAAVHSLLDEGKGQIATTINGLADAVRDMATKLEQGGATPVARYVHDAADTVAGWGSAVQNKSVDDLLGDTRTLVRTSPALAVGLAVAAGFVVARVARPVR